MSLLPDRLTDPLYWQSLMPELTFSAERAYPGEEVAAPVAAAAALRADVLGHGFHVGATGLPQAHELARGAQRLVRAGLHPNWLLLADEVWLLTRTFRPLLRAAFPGQRLIADHYVFLVNPADPTARRGWAPHRDCDDMGFTAGVPRYVTTWIALTDASTANGCMYLLPASDDPIYATYDDSDVLVDPQAALALPGPAGTPLFGTGRVLHWGGRAAPIGPPAPMRLSLSLASAELDYERSSLEIYDTSELPSLAQRVELVFSQVDRYKHRLPHVADEFAQIRHQALGGPRQPPAPWLAGRRRRGAGRPSPSPSTLRA